MFFLNIFFKIYDFENLKFQKNMTFLGSMSSWSFRADRLDLLSSVSRGAEIWSSKNSNLNILKSSKKNSAPSVY
jgi:hypothetical protein